jgi:hypothetical protein
VDPSNRSGKRTAIRAGALALAVLALAGWFSSDRLLAALYEIQLRLDASKAYEFLDSPEGSSERRALRAFLASPAGRELGIDAWYRTFGPDGVFLCSDQDEIKDYVRVPADKMVLAERLLDEHSFEEISSSEQLSRLGVTVSIPPPPRKLYLVRALYYWEQVSFGIWLEGDRLLIDHTIFTTGRVSPMKRAALVLALPAPPREVYIQCAADE